MSNQQSIADQKRILLIDADQTIEKVRKEKTGEKKIWPNTALMQISGYHKAQGHAAGWNIVDPDMIYISSIFKRNKNKALSSKALMERTYPDAAINVGGSGVDLHKKLPDEIFFSRPDYTLYPKLDYSIGSTTTGCIRKCHFCIAHIKEGKHRVVKHPDLFYSPRFKKIIFQDNNILANKEWFLYVCDWVKERKLRCDFNQGLDARLFDKDVADALSELKVIERWHIAYDDLAYEKSVEKAIDLMREAGINTRRRLSVYVYCDGQHDVESAVKRCSQVKKWGASAFSMCNIDVETTPEMQRLKDWTRPECFHSVEYDEVDRRARA